MEDGRRSLSWPGDEEGPGWGILSLTGSCGVGAGLKGRTGSSSPLHGGARLVGEQLLTSWVQTLGIRVHISLLVCIWFIPFSMA